MITIEENSGLVTLRLPAEFNYKSHREFRECYAHRSPKQAYVIDFSNVIKFDSSALGMLLLLRSHCGENKANIHLINCNPHVRRVLEVARFNDFFRIDTSGAPGWWPGK
ncbi:MAG: STAS domain-containing protein [Magnetococcus sp. DMHC-1]|nr:STAS domain-containing protein [Magnetococcales bacterium]